MEEVGEKIKAKKESLLQTDDGEGKDGEGKDGEGKEDDDEEDFDFLGELGEKVKRKFKEVKEKIELAKNKRSKRSSLRTDDGEGEDFNPEDLTIVKILEHLFEGLPEEDRAEIEAKMEELKKMLEEECEKHPDMKAKMEEVGEKIKAKKESLLQTDDGEGKDGEGKEDDDEE